MLYMSDLWQTTAENLEGAPYNLVALSQANSNQCLLPLLYMIESEWGVPDREFACDLV